MRSFLLQSAVLCVLTSFVTACGSGGGNGKSASPLVPTARSAGGLSAANHPRPIRRAPIADSEIDGHIDVKLPKHDRQIMHQLMKDLRPEDRYNVGFFALGGTNYANTRSVLATMRRWKSLDGKAFVGDGGHRFTGPAIDTLQSVRALKSSSRTSSAARTPLGYETPTPSDGQGPFRRVYSDAGYSREQGYVYLPCQATNFNELTGQTGYVYGGGFGQNDDGLDAGYQYSIANNSYTLFSRDSGTDGPNQIDAQGANFACGQTVSYDLYSTVDPTYGLMTVIVGTGNDVNGQAATETVMDPSNPNGFPMDGQGVRMKRMTSIAQGSNDFTNGSTFGINFDGTPEVAWSSSNLGIFDPANNVNYISPWPEGNGGTQSFPDDSTKIVVTYTDMADETDGISLHQ